jgi:hypothetical protein
MSHARIDPQSAKSESITSFFLTTMSMAVRQYRFPPFPPAPEGVKIVPFKAFTEYGTRVVGPDEVERDGLGIPTIALPKKKEKNDKTVVVKNGPSVRKDWWEDWKTTGPLRGSYDPYV